jgi:hypothetical protein
MKNAGEYGRELPAVFARETGGGITTVADQLVTGRMCWAVMALRWVVTEGVHEVPESKGWIDELVGLVSRPSR